MVMLLRFLWYSTDLIGHIHKTSEPKKGIGQIDIFWNKQTVKKKASASSLLINGLYGLILSKLKNCKTNTPDNKECDVIYTFGVSQTDA